MTSLTSVYPHCWLVAAASLADLHQHHVDTLVRLPDTLRADEVEGCLQMVEVAVDVLQRMVGGPVHIVVPSLSSRTAGIHGAQIYQLLDVLDDGGVSDAICVKNLQQICKQWSDEIFTLIHNYVLNLGVSLETLECPHLCRLRHQSRHRISPAELKKTRRSIYSFLTHMTISHLSIGFKKCY